MDQADAELVQNIFSDCYTIRGSYIVAFGLTQFVRQSQQISEKEPIPLFEVLNFIKEWLEQHVSEMDMKYARYFNAQGIS